MSDLKYAALDTDGSILAIEADVASATEAARHHGAPDARILVDDLGPVPNPRQDDFVPVGSLSVTRMPLASLEASGLPRVTGDDVGHMTLEEAHKALRGHFPRRRRRASGSLERVRAYDTPREMRNNLLGQNYKTAKQKPGEDPSDVQGLSLLPHALVRDLAPSPIAGVRTLCLGSNEACRQGCLVYSGQNKADPYNLTIKIARSTALVKEPVAFCRMVLEACRFHGESAPRRGYRPYIRLNVFSDVPWELVFPDLFELLPGLQFYDYTKVAARRPPSNYDLTFSFSGTNERLARHEIEKEKRRIAVVFLLPGGYVARRTADLPARFWGLEVVDGDVSDLRPLDASPVVVGLRWKTPMGQGIDPTVGKFQKFVVPCFEEDGHVIAAVGARQEPIIDADEGEEV